jgi:hypothetical protein
MVKKKNLKEKTIKQMKTKVEIQGDPLSEEDF